MSALIYTTYFITVTRVNKRSDGVQCGYKVMHVIVFGITSEIGAVIFVRLVLIRRRKVYESHLQTKLSQSKTYCKSYLDITKPFKVHTNH